EMKRPVVIPVVTIPDITHRRLRRYGFQRRMRIHETVCREKPGIRDAPTPTAPIFGGKMLPQPLYGVVSVRAFVRIRRPAEVRLVRRDINERPLREIPSPHILIRESESFLAEQLRGPHHRPVV